MLMQERDRLRKLADELRTHGTFVGFGGSESRDPLMHEAAEAMESAAETIWDLHKKLVAANADVRKAQEENAKLREDLAQWERLTAGIELPEYPITQFQPKDLERENKRLREENAKLRSELESVGTAAYLYGRGDLQAENAKLREELADMSKCETCEAMLDCDECLRADDSQKERKRIDFENAKLRELVRELWEGYQDPPCEDCPYKDTPTCADCSICAREATVIDCMRELGVWVD